MSTRALRRQLLLSTTLIAGALTGYGRRAYGACVNTVGSQFECSGTEVTPQTVNFNNADVFTLATPAFSVTTAASALTITGDGALSYTDTNASPLTGTPAALFIQSNGDDGLTPGSVTVNTNGVLTGSDIGILARNLGSGALDITANGDVTGLTNFGIYARNYGTDLRVTTGLGTTVTGDTTGIVGQNLGTGALDVTANGDVTGTVFGIVAVTSGSGTDLSVTTGAGTAVTGGTTGIFARNLGSGPLHIAANGNVTGTSQYGIYARNNAAGTDLSVTTGAGTTVTGANYGIFSRNYGTGALDITVNGNVGDILTIIPTSGIYARNFNGTDLSVTTGAGTTVTGNNIGILSRNYGSGALDITANGNVTGTNAYGIFAQHQGTDLTVTTAAGTTVSGVTGIYLASIGSGPHTITVNGNVAGTSGDGIYVASFASPINLTVGATSTVTGSGVGAFGIETSGAAASVTVAGTVNGGGGGAISFDCGCTNDRLELHPTAIINGLVLAGGGTDTFVLGGSGTASFDVSNIGPQYQDFETFIKEDASHWTLTGTQNAGISSWDVNGGLLSVNATMQNTTFFVNGGTLGGTGTIGGLFANSGGTIAPGNSIGTLHVANVTFDPGSFYQVEIDDAGNSDLIDATGTATLNGGTVQVLALPGTYVANTQYTIITTGGGRTGTFAGVTDNLAFFDAVLSYDALNVYLNLLLNSTSFTSVAQTPNQQAVAGALDTLPPGDPLVAALIGQTTAGALQAFDALSGEVHATIAGVLMDDSRYVRDAIFARLLQAFYGGGGASQVALAAGGPMTIAADDPFTAGRMALGAKSRGAPAAPAYGNGLALWAQGYGAWGDFDGNGNAADADRTLGGFVSGMDVALGGKWRAGVASGYAQSDVGVDARLSSADVESFHLAAYAGGPLGGIALRGGGAWTWSQIDTSRAIVFPGFVERADASYDGDTGQVFGEVALPLGSGTTALEPFGRLAYVHVATGGFTESGGIAALTSGGNDEDVGYSALGLRVAAVMRVSGMQVTPHASLAWQHAFGDVEPAAALAFASNGIGFTVYGVPLARDTALVDAGIDLAMGRDATLGLGYSGQLGDDVADHAVTGRLDWRF